MLRSESFARAWAAIIPLKLLPIGERLWASAPSPTLRHRRMFGGEIILDVSRSNAHRVLYLGGERFGPEAKLVRSLLKPGSPAIDVGANIGYYMLLLRQAGGRPVVCIEPEPDNLIELRRVIAANPGDVELIEAAASDQPGQVSLIAGLNGRVGPDGELCVRAVRLDDVAPPGVSFIKIDVEGYEYRVFQGARRVIDRWRPNLFIELHPWMEERQGDTRSLIAEVKGLYADVTIHAAPIRSRRGLVRAVSALTSAKVVPLAEAPHERASWLVARSRRT